MLALSLEAIRRTSQANQLDVRIFVDNTTSERLEEVRYVRDTYFPEAMIFHAHPHIQVPSGMWNILQSLKAGFETGAEYVFLIEEDILVRPDFFDWHYTANSQADLATCGRKIPTFPSYNQYTNPGSCFHRAALARIVPHINDEMFQDRRAYYERQWGIMDEASDLDDGMIRRFAKFHGLSVIYPETAKCSHIGFRAYNHYMGWTNEGNIQERIANLRKMLPTIDPNGRYTRDFEPISS